MQWERIECSVRPEEVDTTSSAKYVYVHRNIEKVEATEERSEYYVCEELKILKDNYGAFSEHNIALDDIYAALVELAELIA